MGGYPAARANSAHYGDRLAAENEAYGCLNFWCRAMTSRVYVIDDDERFRNSLCALIKSVGLKVDGWSNPEELLNKTASSPRAASCSTTACPRCRPRGPAPPQTDSSIPAT